MLTNLLFFIAFVTVSYLVSRLANDQRSLRALPVRNKISAGRRSFADLVR